MTAYENAPFDRCSDCRCSSEDLAASNGRCPRMVATTEPGALAETREKRKPNGAGLALSVVAVLAVIGCWVSAGWLAEVVRSVQR